MQKLLIRNRKPVSLATRLVIVALLLGTVWLTPAPAMGNPAAGAIVAKGVATLPWFPSPTGDSVGSFAGTASGGGAGVDSAGAAYAIVLANAPITAGFTYSEPACLPEQMGKGFPLEGSASGTIWITADAASGTLVGQSASGNISYARGVILFFWKRIDGVALITTLVTLDALVGTLTRTLIAKNPPTPNNVALAAFKANHPSGTVAGLNGGLCTSGPITADVVAEDLIAAAL